MSDPAIDHAIPAAQELALDRIVEDEAISPRLRRLRAPMGRLVLVMQEQGAARFPPVVVAGPRPEDGTHADPAQWVQRGYLGVRAASIASGTSEIMRGIIAMQVLGLPRGS